MEEKYLTLSNLSTFLKKLKENYADNSANKYTVNHALSADKDSKGNQITTTYQTIADFNTFKTAYDEFEKDTKAFAYDKIHSISLKGSNSQTATTLTPDGNKNIEIDLSAYALLTDITSVLQFKGTLENLEALNNLYKDTTKTIKVGDVYLLKYGATYDNNDSDNTSVYTEQNVEYVCTSISTDTNIPVWEKLGSTYDFSIYAEKTWVTSEIKANKTTTDATITALTNRVSANETAIATLNGSETTDGSVKKTATTIATKIVDDKVNALDYDSSSLTGEFVVNVKQTDGLIAVTKGSLTTATSSEIESLFS